MYLQLLCGFLVCDRRFRTADGKPAVDAFAALAGLMTAAVEAGQLVFRRGGVVVTFTVSDLLSEIACHLAVDAFDSMLFINRIAIIADQHGFSIYHRRRNDAHNRS